MFSTWPQASTLTYPMLQVGLTWLAILLAAVIASGGAAQIGNNGGGTAAETIDVGLGGYGFGGTYGPTKVLLLVCP